VAETFDPPPRRPIEGQLRKQKYVERNAPYASYQSAYRAGYEGKPLSGKRYEEVETNLQRD
jgi:hypothetical protein